MKTIELAGEKRDTGAKGVTELLEALKKAFVAVEGEAETRGIEGDALYSPELQMEPLVKMLGAAIAKAEGRE